MPCRRVDVFHSSPYRIKLLCSEVLESSGSVKQNGGGVNPDGHSDGAHSDKTQHIAAITHVVMRQVAANHQEQLRQIAANMLPLLVGSFRVAAFRSSAQRRRWGMVSNQMTGFQVSESRHKSRSAERIKLDDDGRTERAF